MSNFSISSTIEEPGFKDYENVPSRAPPNGHTPPSNGHTPNIPPSNGHIETKTRGSISGHCRVGNRFVESIDILFITFNGNKTFAKTL